MSKNQSAFIYKEGLTPGTVQVTTANTNLDGSGANFATVVTGGADGSMVELVHIKAAGVTTLGMIRFWITDGVNKRLIDEVPVTAATPSSTVESFSMDWTPSKPLFLPSSSYQLLATTHNTETFNLAPFGGNY